MVETIVGAVHLSAGYDAAAGWAVEMCLPGERVAVGGDTAGPEALGQMGFSDLAFVGAALIDAVIADHLCTSSPDRTQGWYSNTKNSLRRRKRLAAIATEGQPTPERPASVARASDRLEAELAGLYFERGWGCAPDVLTRLQIN